MKQKGCLNCGMYKPESWSRLKVRDFCHLNVSNYLFDNIFWNEIEVKTNKLQKALLGFTPRGTATWGQNSFNLWSWYFISGLGRAFITRLPCKIQPPTLWICCTAISIHCLTAMVRESHEMRCSKCLFIEKSLTHFL